MTGFVQIPLDGNAMLLVRIDDQPHDRRVPRPSPVRTARLGDRIGLTATTAPYSLRETLSPLTQMSRQVVEQLTQSGPSQLQVEFGVELTTEAGAVLAKTGSNCHLTVTVAWAADAAAVTPTRPATEAEQEHCPPPQPAAEIEPADPAPATRHATGSDPSETPEASG